VTISIYKAELEKKTREQSADEGKKLACRKAFCDKHSMQQKENSKIGRKSRPIKPVVKTRRREVKPFSPSSELGASSWSEEEDGWGKESEDEVDAGCLYCAVCSLKTTTVKNGFDAKKSTVV
jgi:hypothetical protein